MNQRIFELAEQALEETHRVMGSTVLPEAFDDYYTEKFAELIVEECISVALSQKKWVEDQDVFGERDRDWNKARIQQSQRIVNKIREHFGVE